MALTANPFALNDVSLTLELVTPPGTPVEYRCQLNRAELVPSAQSTGSEMETFCATFPAPPKTASWTLELAGFQAYADVTDLSRFLFANELSEAHFVLTPMGGVISATNPGYEGTVILSPAAIGGTANNYAALTVSLVVSGKPTEITTPPVAAVAEVPDDTEEPVTVAA